MRHFTEERKEWKENIFLLQKFFEFSILKHIAFFPTFIPSIEQGQVLMTLFALKQRVPVCDMAVIPLTQVAEDHCENGMNNNSRSQRDMEEMERWLGSSLLPQEKTSSRLVICRKRQVI